MEPTEKETQENLSENGNIKETILHEDIITVVPDKGHGEILGEYLGMTEDQSHAKFKHVEKGHTFHIPIFGALSNAIGKVTDPIGKIFSIFVLDVGRYLIKLIEKE